ncbi:hypothetical protein FRC12_014147 [Ceratobasidium sp. 428]|nr:hypothetical protein FRC12_014147 [Ceratobasidium sp. 428]
MRRAPSSRARQNDALRNSVFDAAHSIGLAGPNALQWLEQNANISEEDEEEEDVKREPRPPSDTHPPSLVFSTSSSEPDSSVNSPSNDHSTNFRAPYPRPTTKAQYQAYAQSQFHPQTQPSSQLQIDPRLPPNSNPRNSPNPPTRPPPAALGLNIPDPWPPTQLSIASLSPSPQSLSRAPTPADTINSKQAPEPRKARKLTKAPRADVEPEVVPFRKASAGSENGLPGLGGAPPMLPALSFPSGVSGGSLSSDASVSGLSAVSGSSSGSVTQPKIAFPEQDSQSVLFPLTPTANERSVFEDDNDDDMRPSFSTIPSSSTTVTTSNHTHNAPSTSSADASNTNTKEKEGKGGVLRAMRSFKLSLKSQKAPKVPLPEAPPVPVVPSLPPVLTLKLGKGAGAELIEDLKSQGNDEHKRSQEKDREERAQKLAELFKPSETGPKTSSVYTTQSSEAGVRSDVGHLSSDHGHPRPAGPQSDQGHAPIRVAGGGGGGGGFWSANVGAKKDWTNNPPKAAKPRRMSVDQANGAGEVDKKETAKVTERTRAGTVGTRSGHARTRSKSGDFAGLGWEKAAQPPVPVPVPNAPKGSKPAKTTVKRIANPDPISPKLSFDSETRHSLERSGFGARAELDEIRALDVQHQLQSFVASMRGIGDEDEVQAGFSRASEESFDRRVIGGPRGRGDDSDTLRSSGEYDPDPFRAFVGQPRSITTPLPRPESEAIPHKLVIPAHSIPKELGQTSAVSAVAPVPRRAFPPTAFKSSENEEQVGRAQTSRPSIVIGGSGEPPAGKIDQPEGHARNKSQESEHGLGYSGFDFARESTADTTDAAASEEWIVPSPSWAPLDPKRGRSPGPDSIMPEPQPKFLGVRPDRQRASGLSIPRSVTPDSPAPMQLGLRPPSRSVTPLAAPRSVTPLAAPRSITPLATSRSVTPLGGGARPFVPLVSRSLTPQPSSTEQARGSTPPRKQGTMPSRQPSQLEERNTPSPPIPRRALPVRTSSISSISSGEQSLGLGSGPRVRSPPPRIVVPSPVPGPRSAQAASTPRSMTSTPISRSMTSTPISRSATSTPLSLSRGPVPRSMSTTPTPRASEEEPPLRHEAFSRFLAPDTIPAAQKRGRVSPFPTRPVERGTPKSSLEEESQPSQREKYPGGAEKYGSDGFMQVPRVRFIGVRSSNGSSQAGWQGRMEDMRQEGPPARIGSWVEYGDESRPVSWEGGLAYDDPAYSTYDDRAVQYSAYTDEPQENDAQSSRPNSGTSPNIGAAMLSPSGWEADAPASRASIFTLASEYDDEEPIPDVPKTQKLAAAVRGMGQNTWARGRI